MGEAFLDKLQSDMETIVGKGNVSTNIYDRIAYAIDPMPYDLEEKNIPAIVVLPGSTQEISEILKYANIVKKYFLMILFEEN